MVPAKNSYSTTITALILLAAITIGLIIYYSFAASYSFIIKNSLNISDSAYHLLATKAFWNNATYDIYDFSNQTAILSEAFGTQVNQAMTISVLPTALVIWAPFVLFSDVQAMYSAWMGFSLAIFAYAVIKFLIRIYYLNSKAGLILYAAMTCTSLSFSMQNAFGLGQTSILQAACLLLLELNCNNTNNNKSFRLKNIFWLFLLSIKPQFFLLGAGLLWMHRRYQDAIWGAILIAICCLLLTPKLGFYWPEHYISTLLIFKSGQIPNEYFGIVPAKMNIFRTAFDAYIGARYASLVTWGMLSSTYLVAVTTPFISTLLPNIQVIKKINILFCQQLMFSAYLLFAPHSGFYEEIILSTIIASFTFSKNARTLLIKYRYIWMVALILLLNRIAFLSLEGYPMFWWSLKLTFLAMTCSMFWEKNCQLEHI